MGEPTLPKPVKPIFGALYHDRALLAKAVQLIETHFGPADYFSPEHPFVESDYYDEEMGEGLTRRFFSLQRLAQPDALIHMKHLSNLWETQFAEDGRRRLNLDPGYVRGSHLALASTKDFSHRVYIGRGIYAEVTMRYENGDFTTLPWTYPDYYNHRDDFEAIRRIYKEQLKKEGLPSS